MNTSSGKLDRYLRADGSLEFLARCPHGRLTIWVARESGRPAPRCECWDECGDRGADRDGEAA